MTKETLNHANELAKKIEYAEEQLSHWETAKNIGNNSIYLQPKAVWADIHPETFTIIKSLNVAHFTDLIHKLTAELLAL